MRVESLIVCRRATQQGGYVDLEGVGTDTYIFDSFPATAPNIPLIVRAVGSYDDQEHHLVIQVRDSKDAMQSETIETVRFASRAPDLPEGWEMTAMVIRDMQITFAEPGAFVISASIDGQDAQRIPIFARRR